MMTIIILISNNFKALNLIVKIFEFTEISKLQPCSQTHLN